MFESVELEIFTSFKDTLVRLIGLVVVEFTIVEVPLIPSVDAVIMSK